MVDQRNLEKTKITIITRQSQKVDANVIFLVSFKTIFQQSQFKIDFLLIKTF